MPTIYRKADDDLANTVQEALQRYRSDLDEAGVTVETLTAHGEADEPVLKLHGYSCAAVVSIKSLKDRAGSSADARIIVDDATWSDFTEAQRDATLHHELLHLLLVRNKAGAIEHDQAGRPKLKMRLHDVQLGAFREVVERHKEHAPESTVFAAAHKIWTQSRFPWGQM